MSNEYLLDAEDLLISRTNLQGKITYANPAFVKASGYSLDELLGADHNLVRHPDMPPEAFEDLWSTVHKGQLWQGLVKNRRKNGQFYWVKANVLPLVEQGKVVGYASLRVCPDPSQVKQAEAIYQAFNKQSKPAMRLKCGELKPASAWQGLLNLPFTHSSFLFPLALFLINGLLLGLASLFILSEAPVEKTAHPFNQLGLILLAGLAIIFNLFVLLMYRLLHQPAKALQNFALQMAAGNLTFPTPDANSSDLGRLTDALSIMQRGLFSIAQDVYQSVEEVTPSISSIHQSNLSISQQVSEQADSIKTMASTLEELTGHVQENAGYSKKADTLALASAQKTQEVEQVTQEASAAMHTTEQLTAKMSGILESLQSLSFQTNILALNAAVEAARAGEEGRGFAVVAGEVKKLATRSSQAATEASKLINSVSQQITATAAYVTTIQTHASQVNQGSQKLKSLMSGIERASRQQSAEVAQITQEASAIRQNIHTSNQHAESTTQATHQLQEEAQQLDAAVRAFRIHPSGQELKIEIYQ